LETFSEGEFVMIFEPKKRKKLVVKLVPNKRIHTQWGYIEPSSIIGKEPGSTIETHLGKKLIIFRPLLYEKIEHSKIFKYATQIVRPRDWGLIVSFADIGPGKIVVEIGTGSGGFTAFLSHLVAPNGRVYSYEVDSKRASIAKENLKNLGVPPTYIIKVRDVIKEGIDESDVDAVFVDIPEPWLVVDHAYRALKPGGVLICYVPTFNQIQRLLESLERKFSDVKIVDHFYRELQSIPTAIRPLLESYVFSAFILFGRKLV